MEHILNPVQIEKACVKLVCADDNATAFFIAPGQLLTAFHAIVEAIDGAKDIYIQLNGGPIKCTVAHYDKESDLCILDAAQASPDYLPLTAARPKINETCSIYGYPFHGQLAYVSLTGKIKHILYGEKSDFVVGDIDVDGNYDYGGLSGGPIVVAGSVIGISLRQTDNKITALSIRKIKSFLTDHEIMVKEEDTYYEVPTHFGDEMINALPNYEVLAALDEVISRPFNWFLLQGSPGSGKSTVLSAFVPTNQQIKICGHYFIKIPNGNEPVSLRSSVNFFSDTIENMISVIVTGEAAPKDEGNSVDRQFRLTRALQNLSAFLKIRNEIGVIIIDGLDEIKDLPGFLGVFPESLPSRLKVVLGCTAIEMLPTIIQNRIGSSQIVKVTALNQANCEEFILKEVLEKNISLENIRKIAIKSEGHPLYLRYLINYIKSGIVNTNVQDFDQWIDGIPSIGGDITRYYNSIWEGVRAVPDKLWQLLILAQIRQGILKEDLYQMMPHEFKLSFHSYFPSIAYLLTKGEKIEIYHSSFKIYIASQVKESIGMANDFILSFCDNFPEHEFSVSNMIFHAVSASRPADSMARCTQEWADQCARYSVSPDLVLDDIRSILRIAIKECNAIEVIRVLLFLQRLEFRYEEVFTDNATLIAGALAAAGDFEAAIKYIVRQKSLFVGIDDAISFLQCFYENGALEVAEILLEAIDAKYRALIQDSAGQQLDIYVFAFRMKAMTLSMNKNFEKNAKAIALFQMKLKKFQDRLKEHGDTTGYDQFEGMREYAAAWHMAYVIRAFDTYIDSKAISESLKTDIDERWSTMRAFAVLCYKELDDYNQLQVAEGTAFPSLIADIEYLITHHGYVKSKGELQMLVLGLMSHSQSSGLLVQLIDEYLTFPAAFQLKKPNGVDLNKGDVYELYFQFVFRGYSDGTSAFRQVDKHPTIHAHWEKFITSLIESIGFIEGRFQRRRADGAEASDIIHQLKIIIGYLGFTLAERCRWGSSYHLPEAVLPFLWGKITAIFCEFATGNMAELIGTIIHQANVQMGLYSEGYCDCLYEVVKVLVKRHPDKQDILAVLSIWEDHVLANVLNRRDRTPELLKLVEFYGLLGDEAKTLGAFNEMLHTSMGPGWYKEAQLDLLNTTLSMPSANRSSSTYIKRFSGMLDYAAGEMTFQRYVRHEKGRFIGSLIKRVGLAKAIDYFTFEVFPDPSTLIFNAERKTADIPYPGHGYSLGARNLIEQAGILEMLDSGLASPPLRWALCSIFTINDDTFRYINEYAKNFARIVTELEQSGCSYLDDIYVSIAEIAADKANRDNVREFINTIGKGISEDSRRNLQHHFSLKGIQWNLEKPADITDDNDKERNAFDEFNESMSGGRERTQLIADGLATFNKERINLLSPWSKASSVAQNNIRGLFNSDKEVVFYLGDAITNYLDEPWQAAQQLLWYLEDRLFDQHTEELYKVVHEHFSLIIRPETTFIEKYNWIEDEQAYSSDDDEMTSFIIGLMDHPVKSINTKSSLAIQKLLRYDASLILSKLIDCALSGRPVASTEKSSLLLKQLALETPGQIIKILQSDPALVEKMVQADHFTIKANFRALGKALNEHGYGLLYESISDVIPVQIKSAGDIELEENYLKDIEFEIQQLNELQILNRSFCISLLKKIEEYVAPLTISEFRKSDKYLLRSFYEDKNESGRFGQLLRFALNVSILQRVDRITWDAVYDILNA